MAFSNNIFLIRLFAFLCFLFFSHGVLYYFHIDQHYLASDFGWLQLIKYIIFSTFILIFIIKGFLRLNLFLFLLIQTIGLLVIYTAENNNKIILVISFLVPTLCLLMPFCWLSKEISSLIRFSLLISLSLIFINFLALVYEIANGPIVSSYSRSSFRATGIFVNPNNSSIFSVFLFCFVFLFSGNRFVKFFVFILTSFGLIVLGSKTGLLIFFILIFFLFFNSLVRFFLLLFVLVYMLFLYNIIGFYELDVNFDFKYRSPLNFESAFIRIRDWMDLGRDLYNGSILNFLFGWRDVYFIDNGYMDILSNFGIFMLILFLVLQCVFIFISLRFGRFLILFNLIFLVAMITTNVHRIWPISYVYWALMGWSFYYFNIQNRKLNKGDVSV